MDLKNNYGIIDTLALIFWKTMVWRLLSVAIWLQGMWCLRDTILKKRYGKINNSYRYLNALGNTKDSAKVTYDFSLNFCNFVTFWCDSFFVSNKYLHNHFENNIKGGFLWKIKETQSIEVLSAAKSHEKSDHFEVF